MVACLESYGRFWNFLFRSVVVTILVGSFGCEQNSPQSAPPVDAGPGEAESGEAEVTGETEAAPTVSLRSVSLEGLHAYAQKSLDAGDTLQLHVSSTVPYKMTIRRLHTWIDQFERMDSLHQTSVKKPQSQPIHPGSYIHVPQGLTQEDVKKGFSLECWVRPWRLDRFQAIMTQAMTGNPNGPGKSNGSGKPHGFGLFLDSRGRVVFQVAAAEVGKFRTLASKNPLKKYQWFHLVATWKEGKSSLWIDGEFQGAQAFDLTMPLLPPQVPLRFGAVGAAGQVDSLADIDLALPVVHRGVLDSKAIAARFTDRGQSIPAGDSLLGVWPLDEEEGSTIHDRSGHGRGGQIINGGTWMIGGPSFDSKKVSRFGDYDPLQDPSRGHGIRLISDDLYDCHWKVTHRFPLPDDAPSGVYVAHFQYAWKGKAKDYFVTFIVRPPSSPASSSPALSSPQPPKQSPILVLCSTNTWIAYNSSPFPSQGDPTYWPIGGVKSEPGAPHYSCYVDHDAGQPAFHHGLNIPWPGAGPEMLFSPKEVGYSQQLRIERFTHCWLEREGFAYDVISDMDLDENPSLVEGYQAVIISGHSEYWSAKAYKAIQSYLDKGGNLAVLSGNTMFWRVDYDRARSRMECRKKELNSDQRGGTAWSLGWDRPVGELFHSSDKKRGGLLRQCGMPAYRLIGLESIAWWNHTKKELFDVFHVDDPDHFLFQGPIVIRKKKGESIGQGKQNALPRGVGHETDVRISRVRAMTKRFPPGWTGSLPSEEEGMVVLASAKHSGAVWTIIDYFGISAKFHDEIASEVIYWQRPSGGQVFNAGSVGAGWPLLEDESWSGLLRNVLHHFGVTPEKDALPRGNISE